MCRKASHSINFIVAHDGFTLHDLVSYNQKHNEANGEDGKDGTNDNLSWNCGVEGPTNDKSIRALRWQQMRNFHLALIISQGTPMVVAGVPHCGYMSKCDQQRNRLFRLIAGFARTGSVLHILLFRVCELKPRLALAFMDDDSIDSMHS
jgi:hypothetical protein